MADLIHVVITDENGQVETAIEFPRWDLDDPESYIRWIFSTGNCVFHVRAGAFAQD